jgi:hypothetical protein
MTRRTSVDDFQDIDAFSDLDNTIVDKRSAKRATPAKGRRRNRRYENRLLRDRLDISEFPSEIEDETAVVDSIERSPL